MKYLLDTCVLLELIKPQPNKRVSTWLANINEADLFISVFTIGELRKGIDKLVMGKQKQKLNRWFQEIIDWSDNRILTFDKVAAKNWGALSARLELNGRPMPIIDSMIASIAMTHECSLVTCNIQDFIEVDVSIINPWDSSDGNSNAH